MYGRLAKLNIYSFLIIYSSNFSRTLQITSSFDKYFKPVRYMMNRLKTEKSSNNSPELPAAPTNILAGKGTQDSQKVVKKKLSTPAKVDDDSISSVSSIVWDFYRDHSRSFMPWRQDVNPYWILVSELMLQQTQVSRVIPKFEQFVAKFPTFHKLAEASFEDVLREWSGLGYNRK